MKGRKLPDNIVNGYRYSSFFHRIKILGLAVHFKGFKLSVNFHVRIKLLSFVNLFNYF